MTGDEEGGGLVLGRVLGRCYLCVLMKARDLRNPLEGRWAYCMAGVLENAYFPLSSHVSFASAPAKIGSEQYEDKHRCQMSRLVWAVSLVSSAGTLAVVI